MKRLRRFLSLLIVPGIVLLALAANATEGKDAAAKAGGAGSKIGGAPVDARTPSPPPLDTEWLRRNQGLVTLVQENKIDEALQSGLDAMKYLQGKNLLEGQEAATAHNNLGMIYLQRTQFDRAHPHLLKALEMRTRLTGPESLDVATVWLNLGQLYRLQGEQIIQLNRQRAEAAAEKKAEQPPGEKKPVETGESAPKTKK